MLDVLDVRNLIWARSRSVAPPVRDVLIYPAMRSPTRTGSVAVRRTESVLIDAYPEAVAFRVARAP